jgi:hypothetical protein
MQAITSLTNPSLFSAATALPTGFHYILKKIGEYNYGNFNNDVYQIGIVREIDGTVVWGDTFHPSNQYSTAAQMIVDEANNSWSNWQQYSEADDIAMSASSIIGF